MQDIHDSTAMKSAGASETLAFLERQFKENQSLDLERFSADQIRELIRLCYSLERRLRETERQLISGFYEDEYPVYEQGPPRHELQELATAEEINGLVAKFRELVVVVRLLDALGRNLLRRKFDHCGAMNATQLCERDAVLNLLQKASNALRGLERPTN